MNIRPTIELEQLDQAAYELILDHSELAQLEPGTTERTLSREFPEGSSIELSFRGLSDWVLTTRDTETSQRGHDYLQERRFYRNGEVGLIVNSRSPQYQSEHGGGPSTRARVMLALITLREQIELEEAFPA